MLHRLTALVTLALLAGCGASDKAETAAPAATPAISAPDPLSIRPTGVGPLGDGTPFDKALVEGAFPGATVESAVMQLAEERTPVLNVLAAGTQTLQIVSDGAGQIGAINVTGGDYVAPGGEKVMTRWADAEFTLDNCVMGSERFTHALLCRKPNETTIVYVFGIPGWTSSEPPSAGILADKAFLREIVWTAPPRAP
jgi:hypothetical protein